MIDHIGFPLAGFAASRALYRAAWTPLGIAVVMEVSAEATGGRAHAGFGATGPHPHDHPYYYGAFILDPDGHTIEAVCHRPH